MVFMVNNTFSLGWGDHPLERLVRELHNNMKAGERLKEIVGECIRRGFRFLF